MAICPIIVHFTTDVACEFRAQWGCAGAIGANVLKVAEHSFQEAMPNSPLPLSHLCFGARFLQESRLTIEDFILAFWLRCVLLPWQRGWLKTRLKKWFLFI